VIAVVEESALDPIAVDVSLLLQDTRKRMTMKIANFLILVDLRLKNIKGG
jgi:hypothetical protein